MINQTHYTQAYKKLGDLHQHWLEAQRLLGTTIEYLPQLMAPPVILFIVGLLDNMISSCIPLSKANNLVFFAGVLSSASAIAIALYTLWTVYHGLKFPKTSLFRSIFLEICRQYSTLR